ncbi:MAG: hypothetical protein OK439_07090 [Thaumarchaeota archaeon]|nr:hypothetical protein [Nitrososphaerota archaeon]
MNDPSIQSLFPDLFKIPRPIITGSGPLIISGTLLHLEEVQMLPIVQGLQPKFDPVTKIKMYATLGGYSVLNAVLKTNPKDYDKLLWIPGQDIPVWIGSLKFTDSYSDLLNVFELTKFGDAAVEGEGSFPALITLQEVLSLFRTDVIESKLRVSEIGSEMIKISSESTLLDALRLMFEKRVRRVFLSGWDRWESIDQAFPFVSSRDIIRFLFSPVRLELAKKHPELWTGAKLSEIKGSYGKEIHSGKIVNQAASEIGNGTDDCLVSHDEKKVVSRYDIVMAPWKAKNYSFKKNVDDLRNYVSN